MSTDSELLDLAERRRWQIKTSQRRRGVQWEVYHLQRDAYDITKEVLCGLGNSLRDALQDAREGRDEH